MSARLCDVEKRSSGGQRGEERVRDEQMKGHVGGGGGWREGEGFAAEKRKGEKDSRRDERGERGRKEGGERDERRKVDTASRRRGEEDGFAAQTRLCVWVRGGSDRAAAS